MSHHPGQQLVHESKAVPCYCGKRKMGQGRCCMMEFIQKLAEMLRERGPKWFLPACVVCYRRINRHGGCGGSLRLISAVVVNYWETNKTIETVNDGFIEIHSADDPDSWLVSVWICLL